MTRMSDRDLDVMDGRTRIGKVSVRNGVIAGFVVDIGEGALRPLGRFRLASDARAAVRRAAGLEPGDDEAGDGDV